MALENNESGGLNGALDLDRLGGNFVAFVGIENFITIRDLLKKTSRKFWIFDPSLCLHIFMVSKPWNHLNFKMKVN